MGFFWTTFTTLVRATLHRSANDILLIFKVVKFFHHLLKLKVHEKIETNLNKE